MSDAEILANLREVEHARDELFDAGQRLQTAEQDKDKAQVRFYKAERALTASVRRDEGLR
jgi:hypothetical protein